MNQTQFQRVGSLHPSRNKFDLSYRKLFTCDMGELIPVMCDEVVPGDHFRIGNELTIRMQPLIAPVMHEIHATVHYFFVPYRLLMNRVKYPTEKSHFEMFITSGFLGTEVEGGNPLPLLLPTFTVDVDQNADRNTNTYKASEATIGTLWDYFGFYPCFGGSGAGYRIPTYSEEPIMYPWFAYNFIFNEYYRDQDLQPQAVELTNPFVLNRNWKKDYFTSARPFRQKGIAPAFPSSYTGAVSFSNPNLAFPPSPSPTAGIPLRLFNGAVAVNGSDGVPAAMTFYAPNGQGYPSSTMSANVPGVIAYNSLPTNTLNRMGITFADLQTTLNAGLTLNTGAASSFDVSDLRLVVQLQKWLERNSRAGTRYTEFLRSHFGVNPRDERLDRPEYVGGTKQSIVVSEVLQTSSTSSGGNLGQFAGHGISATANYAGDYHVKEFGLIMGIMSVMPKRTYNGGFNRQWLRKYPSDFYFPEFALLSEQAIKSVEVDNGVSKTFAVSPISPANRVESPIFGYCGQYDEMRVKYDMICGEMRYITPQNPQLNYWHLADNWNVRPQLNSSFITANVRKDIFAVENVDGLIVNCQNHIIATRPLPLAAIPGLVDHN